jgi:hypothetical protein
MGRASKSGLHTDQRPYFPGNFFSFWLNIYKGLPKEVACPDLPKIIINPPGIFSRTLRIS